MNDLFGEAAVLLPLIECREARLKFLIGVDVDWNNVHNMLWCPPANVACSIRIKSVKEILNFVAINPNKKLENGNTALHYAVWNTRTPIVKELLSYTDIDPNIRNNDGNTALHFACEWGPVDVVRELLNDKRIDINLRNNKGETSMDLATFWGKSKSKIVWLLEKHSEITDKQKAREPAWDTIEGVELEKVGQKLKMSLNYYTRLLKCESDRDKFKKKLKKLQTELVVLKLEKDNLAAKIKKDFVVIMGERLPRRIPESPIELDSTISTLTSLLQTLLASKKDVYTCNICTVKNKDTVMVPCGHQLCHICAMKVDKCPICRVHIEVKTRLY